MPFPCVSTCLLLPVPPLGGRGRLHERDGGRDLDRLHRLIGQTTDPRALDVLEELRDEVERAVIDDDALAADKRRPRRPRLALRWQRAT